LKIIDCQQGSTQWLEARAGVVTASEVDALITPLGEARTGDRPKEYLAQKLAEKWQGPLPANTFWNADQGHWGETDTVKWYQFEHGVKVDRVGFITTDDGLFGCSPDGLIPVNYGLEIKSPGPKAHVRNLLSGLVPSEYWAQVQMSLWVTGYPKWRFISYRRNYPPIVIDVLPQEQFQENLGVILKKFSAQLQRSWERLIELNDGQLPPKREPMVFAHEMNGEEEIGITP